MKAWIIEDETPAVNRLISLIEQVADDVEIEQVADSVESAYKLLRESQPDLLFLDIHLADGISFEIFKQVEVKCPIVFTTAFDQYTLKAFKVNSIDYLLKPIDKEELEQAIIKFRKLNQPTISSALISQIASNWNTTNYRARFLIKQGEQLSYIACEDIAYFYSENGLTRIATTGLRRDVVAGTLDELETELNPKQFHRISRKCIVQLDAIASISKWQGSRLKLELQPNTGFDVLVSRERVSEFQKWLDS